MLQRFDERNRDLIVNINGQLIHRDKAGIIHSILPCRVGMLSGKVCDFITVAFFKLDHLGRLHASAAALSFVEIPVR
jgi:branched-chain amino acid aminotransferase